MYDNLYRYMFLQININIVFPQFIYKMCIVCNVQLLNVNIKHLRFTLKYSYKLTLAESLAHHQYTFSHERFNTSDGAVVRFFTLSYYLYSIMTITHLLHRIMHILGFYWPKRFLLHPQNHCSPVVLPYFLFRMSKTYTMCAAWPSTYVAGLRGPIKEHISSHNIKY